MDRTDPRYVKAQIDLGWAVSGVSNDTPTMRQLMVNPLLEPRVISFHVKDGVNPQPSCQHGNLRALGDGDINFAPIFAAAKNRVRYYLYEYDPVTPGNNGGFNPFTTTDQQLRGPDRRPGSGRVHPHADASPRCRPARPRGQPRQADHGDQHRRRAARLHERGADARRRRRRRRHGDRATTSRSSARTARSKTLAAGQGRRGRRPGDPDVNEAAPAVPAGTCTVNVGFKPIAHQLHVGRPPAVQLERRRRPGPCAALRHEHAATRIGTVGGDVPSHARAEPAGPAGRASAPSRRPSPAATRPRSRPRSPAPPATPSCRSPTRAPSFPGHLVNGTFSLPSALNVRAINSDQPDAGVRAAGRGHRHPDEPADLHRPGQRRPGHDRLPPGDRRQPTCCAPATTARRSPSRCPPRQP